WRGVGCLLVERSDGRVLQPRMDLVGVRTMEFARRWGLVDDVEHSPYPRDYPQDYVYVSSVTGGEFEREQVPTLDRAEDPAPSPQRRERCPQDMFDPILKKFAESHANVEIQYGSRVVAIRELDDVVQVDMVRAGVEGVVTVEADYVVGCDGGDSTVRELL